MRIVSDSWQTYKDAPSVYEAGSPNYPGVVGMGKAIEVLEEVGFDAIEEHEKVLINKLVEGLKKQDNVMIYGDSDDLSDRVGVVSFNFTDVNSFHLSRKMSEIGAVATRRGAFCAHPYVWRLMGISEDQQRGFLECDDSGTPGMIRVSFGIYNTEEEVDEFLRILEDALAICREEITAFNPEY